MRDDITKPTQATVVIAGREYDAHTGLPIETAKPIEAAPTAPAPVRSSAATASGSIHSAPQKSHTLHRRATKKPTTPAPAPQTHQPHASVHKRNVRTVPATSTHADVHRHAPTATQPAPPSDSSDTPDTPAASHPAVKKAHSRRHAHLAPTSKTPKSSQTIKKEAIEKAMNAPAHHAPKKKNFLKRHPRIFSVATASIALFVLAAFLTYANFPRLQVKIAAAQAGIAASYPGVKPDGYRFNGPVEVADGSVTLNFDSNTSDQTYSITQTASSWNSDAVRVMVEEASNDQFITTEDRGLTIYTYDGHAAWVNKSILYTIEGDAGFSSDVIARIASSF